MAADVTVNDDSWTVRRILEWTTRYLKDQGSETPRLDAEILLAHARNCSRIQLYTQFDTPLSDEQRALMRSLVKRRAAAEPVAYLVGHKEFFSLDFVVNRHVLIPRPDTETLVMAALDVAHEFPAPKILELCAGTACIAIALAKNLPAATVVTVELDPHAAEVAETNITRHQLAERVRFLVGDLFEPIDAEERFDLIVSNPPYVVRNQIPQLEPTVKDHEPQLALDGGEDGLDVIRRLIEDAPRHLNKGGWLMFELAPEQAATASELVRLRGFEKIAARPDLSGQPRVIVGQWSPLA